MISINGNIEIPSEWEELSDNQVIIITGLLMSVISDQLSVLDFKMSLLQVLTGYKRQKKRRTQDDIDQINGNLVLIAEQLKFAIKPFYPDQKVLSVLDIELQKKLESHFPEEIHEVDFLPELDMVRDRLKWIAIPKFEINTNPLPYFFFKRQKYHGPRLNIDKNGIAQTSIKAGEFLLANDYVDVYESTGDPVYLDMIVSIYYRPGRERFNQEICESRAPYFENLDPRIKYFTYLFHGRILSYLSSHSKYSVLFEKSKVNDNSVGSLSDVIYQLSHDHYGTLIELSDILLPDLMNLIYKQVSDAIIMMYRNEKSITEIAGEMKMSDDNILKVLKYGGY